MFYGDKVHKEDVMAEKFSAPNHTGGPCRGWKERSEQVVVRGCCTPTAAGRKARDKPWDTEHWQKDSISELSGRDRLFSNGVGTDDEGFVYGGEEKWERSMIPSG